MKNKYIMAEMGTTSIDQLPMNPQISSNNPQISSNNTQQIQLGNTGLPQQMSSNICNGQQISNINKYKQISSNINKY